MSNGQLNPEVQVRVFRKIRKRPHDETSWLIRPQRARGIKKQVEIICPKQDEKADEVAIAGEMFLKEWRWRYPHIILFGAFYRNKEDQTSLVFTISYDEKDSEATDVRSFKHQIASGFQNCLEKINQMEIIVSHIQEHDQLIQTVGTAIIEQQKALSLVNQQQHIQHEEVQSEIQQLQEEIQQLKEEMLVLKNETKRLDESAKLLDQENVDDYDDVFSENEYYGESNFNHLHQFDEKLDNAGLLALEKELLDKVISDPERNVPASDASERINKQELFEDLMKPQLPMDKQISFTIATEEIAAQTSETNKTAASNLAESKEQVAGSLKSQADKDPSANSSTKPVSDESNLAQGKKMIIKKSVDTPDNYSEQEESVNEPIRVNLQKRTLAAFNADTPEKPAKVKISVTKYLDYMEKLQFLEYQWRKIVDAIADQALKEEILWSEEYIDQLDRFIEEIPNYVTKMFFMKKSVYINSRILSKIKAFELLRQYINQVAIDQGGTKPTVNSEQEEVKLKLLS